MSARPTASAAAMSTFTAAAAAVVAAVLLFTLAGCAAESGTRTGPGTGSAQAGTTGSPAVPSSASAAESSGAPTVSGSDLSAVPPPSMGRPSAPPSAPTDVPPTKPVRYAGTVTADQTTGCVLLNVPPGVMYSLLGVQVSALHQGSTATVSGYLRAGVRTPCGEGMPVLQVAEINWQ